MRRSGVWVLLCVADMAPERNALMQHVYPQLKEFCRKEYRLEFQVHATTVLRTVWLESRLYIAIGSYSRKSLCAGMAMTVVSPGQKVTLQGSDWDGAPRDGENLARLRGKCCSVWILWCTASNKKWIHQQLLSERRMFALILLILSLNHFAVKFTHFSLQLSPYFYFSTVYTVQAGWNGDGVKILR